MSNSYIGKFNILQTLETNVHQNILIGSTKENPNDLVIINILHNIKNLGRNPKAKLRKALINLMYSERLDGKFVVVTKMEKGVSLQDYLEKEKPTIDRRLSMVFQYFKNIKRYDDLEHSIKNILINESQIVIEKGKLALNELIIIGETATRVDHLDPIIKKISTVVKKIIFYPMFDGDSEEHVPTSILQFIHELENNPKAYKNLKQIHDDFKNLYLYDENRMNESMSRGKNKNKQSWRKQVSKIMIGAVVFGAISFACVNMLQNKNNLFIIQKQASNKMPTASFKKIQIKDQWQFINESEAYGKDNTIKKVVWEVKKENEIRQISYAKDLIVDFYEPGEYDIVLKVADQKEQWSKEYVKKVNITEGKQEIADIDTHSYESLKHFTILYENKETMIKDYEIYRSGEYAIKFINNLKTANSLSIKDLNLDKHTFISMWVMADAIEDIDIKIEGYKNENIRFTKSMTYKPRNANNWELINIDENIEEIDGIKIMMYNRKSTIWLDDLVFDVYK
ncbi:hypothetical protein [Marinisporobacter balticus]|nr:hypothetical protein [Marinisporobacter balticus]